MASVRKRTRAIAVPGSNVGDARYHLYRQAYRQINQALEQGFYLEAITLVESLVSDRVESRLTFLKGTDFSFKTLGSLIAESKKVETDPVLKQLVTQRLDNWRDARNRALHEMAKLADGDAATWDDRVQSVIPVAEEGLATLRAIDKRYQELRIQSSSSIPQRVTSRTIIRPLVG